MTDVAVKISIADAVRQINRYTHNKELSLRLLYRKRQEHRDKPLQWCVDVVIEQLVKDRR